MKQFVDSVDVAISDFFDRIIRSVDLYRDFGRIFYGQLVLASLFLPTEIHGALLAFRYTVEADLIGLALVGVILVIVVGVERWLLGFARRATENYSPSPSGNYTLQVVRVALMVNCLAGVFFSRFFCLIAGVTLYCLHGSLEY